MDPVTKQVRQQAREIEALQLAVASLQREVSRLIIRSTGHKNEYNLTEGRFDPDIKASLIEMAKAGSSDPIFTKMTGTFKCYPEKGEDAIFVTGAGAFYSGDEKTDTEQETACWSIPVMCHLMARHVRFFDGRPGGIMTRWIKDAFPKLESECRGNAILTIYDQPWDMWDITGILAYLIGRGRANLYILDQREYENGGHYKPDRIPNLIVTHEGRFSMDERQAEVNTILKTLISYYCNRMKGRRFLFLNQYSKQNLDHENIVVKDATLDKNKSLCLDRYIELHPLFVADDDSLPPGTHTCGITPKTDVGVILDTILKLSYVTNHCDVDENFATQVKRTAQAIVKVHQGNLTTLHAKRFLNLIDLLHLILPPEVAV